MEITPEVRQAVLNELCDDVGHMFAFNQVISFTETGRAEIKAQDEDVLPHVYCARCNFTAILVPEIATNYEEAEAKLLGKLKAEDALAASIKEKAARRKEKKV